MDMSERLLASLNAIDSDEKSKPVGRGVPPAGSESVGDDDEAFGLVEVPEFKVEEKESSLKDVADSNITTDANHTRNTTYAMQAVMTELIQNAVRMACQTDNPRAYQVVNELFTQMRGLNKDLLDQAKLIAEVEIKKMRGGAPGLPNGGSSTSVEVTEDGQMRVTETKTTTTDLMAIAERIRQNGGRAEGIEEKEVNPPIDCEAESDDGAGN